MKMSAAAIHKAFVKAETIIVGLTFQHLCDIYKPSDLAASGGEATDSTFILSASGVKCCYNSTGVFDDIKPEGLIEIVNIETSDVWQLPAGTEVASRYLIVMKSPGHELYGRCWLCMGNSTPTDRAPIQTPQRIWVFAKLQPTNVTP